MGDLVSGETLHIRNSGTKAVREYDRIASLRTEVINNEGYTGKYLLAKSPKLKKKNCSELNSNGSDHIEPDELTDATKPVTAGKSIWKGRYKSRSARSAFL